MRNLYDLDRHRLLGPGILAQFGSEGDDTCGAFEVPSVIDRRPLHVIASAGLGWDHVSVSRQNRCPNWTEMEQIKRLFFKDDETAVQFLVPPSQHVNRHEYCLHLWRPNDGREIPMPPAVMV